MPDESPAMSMARPSPKWRSSGRIAASAASRSVRSMRSPKRVSATTCAIAPAGASSRRSKVISARAPPRLPSSADDQVVQPERERFLRRARIEARERGGDLGRPSHEQNAAHLETCGFQALAPERCREREPRFVQKRVLGRAVLPGDQRIRFGGKRTDGRPLPPAFGQRGQRIPARSQRGEQPLVEGGERRGLPRRMVSPGRPGHERAPGVGAGMGKRGRERGRAAARAGEEEEGGSAHRVLGSAGRSRRAGRRAEAGAASDSATPRALSTRSPCQLDGR